MEVNNCPYCGGKVEYSPDDKGLKCLNCGKVMEITCEKFNEKRPVSEVQNEDGYKQWEESRAFQCSNCGAQVILNKYDMSTKCQYCSTSSLVPTDALPGLKPDIVLPFRLSKEKARQEFAKRVKGKFFVPSSFKKKLPKTELGAMYISSFNFAMKDYATYTGIEAYTVSRRGKDGQMISEVHYRPISGSITHQFDNIVIESSDKLTQNVINCILPFNFSESYKYNSDFMKGYSVGYYNRDVTESLPLAEQAAKNSVEGMIKSRYDNVTSLKVHHNISNQNFNYALVPIYFINFKYKGKDYLNLMNGQNGNIGGNLPKSPIKVTLTALFIMLLVFGIPLLIFLLI